jgi:hypothetical protein
MKRRTTLTLDPDVAAGLDEAAHRQRKPFRQVVNEAIRRGLAAGSSARTAKLKPYVLTPHNDGGLMPGLEGISFNRLADQLEDEAIIAKFARRPKRK